MIKLFMWSKQGKQIVLLYMPALCTTLIIGKEIVDVDAGCFDLGNPGRTNVSC